MVDFTSFFNLFSEPEWFGSVVYIWRYTIRFSVLVLDIILGVCIVYLIFRIWSRQHRIKLFYFSKRKVKKVSMDRKFIRQWQKIVKRLSTPTPENLRLAVIDADTLVDTFLKKAGYSGEHMADRLSRIIPSEVKSLEKLWDAHLLRNSLVHVPGSTVSTNEAKKAVTAFEDFLQELGALPLK